MGECLMTTHYLFVLYFCQVFETASSAFMGGDSVKNVIQSSGMHGVGVDPVPGVLSPEAS